MARSQGGQRRQARQARRRASPPPVVLPATIGAVAGALPGTAAAAAAMATGATAGAALAKTAGAVVTAILAVLDRLRRRRQAAIREWLLRAGATPDDIDLALAEEGRREVVYRRLAEERVKRGIRLATRVSDPSARAAAIEQVMRRERLIAEQRAGTSAERVLASAEMAELKRISPQGAYWTLGPRRTHTVDCMAMANRFWPWEVLDIVHPLLHPGCGCELHSLGWAISRGLMSGADIPTVAKALGLARSVIQHVEAEKADAARKYGHLAEARGSQSVSGYVTRSGKHVSGYSRLVDLLEAHPNVETSVSERSVGGGLTVGMIRTHGENRGKGYASAFLRDLLAFADEHGHTIGLTPEQMEKGGLSKAALTRWYREHGFVPNKGRNKDFAFTEAMVRQPTTTEEVLVEQMEIEALEEIEAREALVEAGVMDPAFAAAAPLAVDPRPAPAPALVEAEAIEQTGAMVALFPDPKLAKKLALPGGDPPEQLHVTLAFLGEAADLDFEKAKAAVEAWAKTAPPMKGTLSGIGHFDIGKGKFVTYRSVDLPDLPAPREALVEALDDAGVPAKRDHGFTPHMTLQTGPKLRRPPVKQSPISFSSVTLAWGGERHEFALTGKAEVPSAASA